MANTDFPSYPLFITIVLLLFCAFSKLKHRKKPISELQNWWARFGINLKKESTNRTQIITPTSCQDLPPTIEKESDYSSDWWCDNQIFQLEQRAIFSQNWIYATHRSCFIKPGDYITLKIASFSFFLVLGKDQVLRGFHNVCRHRAYEVTRKERGSSTVLGCRYHGWSYDTKGQLTKAPEFENVPGFDKKLNSLWEIRVEVSTQGLVFINLDAAGSIKSRTLNVELSSVREGQSMLQSKKVGEWRCEGDFNWKIATALRLLTSQSNISPILENMPDHMQYGLLRVFECFSKQRRAIHLQIDLVTTISLYPAKAIWLVTKIIPQSTVKTIVEYELYSWISTQKASLPASSIKDLKDAISLDTEQMQTMQKRAIEANLSLYPSQMQQQNSIRELLVAHRTLERAAGTEIHPAARHVNLSGQGRQDIKLCMALERDHASSLANKNAGMRAQCGIASTSTTSSSSSSSAAAAVAAAGGGGSLDW